MFIKPHADSLFITPERLTGNLYETITFSPRPDWIVAAEFADPEASLEDSAMAIVIGERGAERIYHLYAVSVAALYELTRYGNSIANNSNASALAPDARTYPKIVYAGAPEDNTPITRLIVGAPPRKAVFLSDVPNDLRPEVLKLKGQGKPTKDARERALFHCRKLAQASGAEVEPYIANLGALFGFHDALFGLTPEY